MQRSDDVLDFLDGHTHIIGKRLDVGFFRGDELVERRIQEPDGDGSALESLIKSLEVALLHGQELGESFLSFLDGVGDDHLAHRHDPVGLEERIAMILSGSKNICSVRQRPMPSAPNLRA